MNIDIIKKPLSLHLYGFGDVVADKQYAATGFRLMDRMWKLIRSHGIVNEGKNTWVYGPGGKMFVGVEINAGLPEEHAKLLQTIAVNLNSYAHYKHIGPYALIQEMGRKMTAELKADGIHPGNTYIEIYGHWNQDESKLDTQLIMEIR